MSVGEKRKQVITWRGYSDSISPRSYRIFDNGKIITELSVGARHVLYLTADKEVFAQGANNRKQLGIERCDFASEPVLVTALLGNLVMHVAAGGAHSAACTDREVFCWGANDAGQCGVGSSSGGEAVVPLPTQLQFTDPGLVCTKCKTLVSPTEEEQEVKICDVSLGERHSLAIGGDNKCWGWGSAPQNGLKTHSNRPQIIEELIGAKVLELVAGANHSAAVCQRPRNSPSVPSSVGDGGGGSVGRLSTSSTSRHSSRSSFLGGRDSSLQRSGSVSYSDTNYSLVSGGACVTCGHGIFSLNTDLLVESVNDFDNVFPSVTLECEDSADNHTRRSSLTEGADSRRSSSDDGSLHRVTRGKLVFGDLPTFQPRKSILPQAVAAIQIDLESVNDFFSRDTTQEITEMYNTAHEDAMLKPGLKSQLRSSDALSRLERTKTVIHDISKMYDDSHQSNDVTDAFAPPQQRLSNAAAMKKKRNPLLKASTLLENSAHQMVSGTVGLVTGTAGLIGSAGSSVKDRMTNLTRRSTLLSRHSSMTSLGEESVGSGRGGTAGAYQRSGGVTELFVWGENDYYQLGLGDNKARSSPTQVRTLGSKNIAQICLATRHSVILTTQFQLIGFGSNEFGQMGGNSRFIQSPELLVFKEEDKSIALVAWDVAVGDKCTVFLNDGPKGRPMLYYLGITGSMPVADSDNGFVTLVVNEPSKDASGSDASAGVECARSPRSFAFFPNVGIPTQVYCGLDQINCRLSIRDANVVNLLVELAQMERKFCTHLRLIRDSVVKPFLACDVYRQTITPSFLGPTITTLLNSFCDMVDHVGKTCFRMIDDLQRDCPPSQLLLVSSASHHVDTMNKFLTLFCDAHSIGSFEYCVRVAVSFFEKQKDVMGTLWGNTKQAGGGGGQQQPLSMKMVHVALYHLLERPLTRIVGYIKFLTSLAETCPPFVNEHAVIGEAIAQWENLRRYVVEAKDVAEVTRKYWENCSLKMMEELRHPKRRLVLDSKHTSLHLLGANRLSVNNFTLFSDIFVHSQFSTHQKYALQTIWIEPYKDPNSDNKNMLKLTMPETSLVVYASSADDKLTWNDHLSEAIDRALNPGLVPNTSRVRGVVRAPTARREAVHTFHTLERFKGATYNGHWLNGLPHERGMLMWPDGRTYDGELSCGYQEGVGRLIVPANPDASQLFEENYDGQWEKGTMHGIGVLNYHNGEQYAGEFQNNMRHGHGCLKLASEGVPYGVFYGEYFDDKRKGYGILEDSTRRERYIGMWDNDMMHGNGVLVSNNRLYYEGGFVAGRLQGTGFMLAEDDTMYEGEMSGVAMAGKGILTFPHGDFMEGSFEGCWEKNEIKVRGTLKRFETGQSSKPMGSLYRKFKVDADIKWEAIFRKCRRRLCVNSFEKTPSSKIWDKLLVMPELSLDAETKKLYKDARKLSESNWADFNPDEKAIITKFLKEITSDRVHPVCQLVDELVIVFKATYSDTGAHKRLLPDASEEMLSICKRIHTTLTLLLPCLEWSRNESSVDSLDEDVTVQLLVSELVYPVFVPRVYSCIFSLYALAHEERDELYMIRARSLNRKSALALMQFYGVERHFHPPSESRDEGEDPWKAAVDAFKYISTKLIARQKLQCVKDTFARLGDIARTLAGPQYIMSMDSLMPLFMFIMVRASVPYLGAELQYIEDFSIINADVSGESEFLFQTVKIAFYQITTDKLILDR